MNFKSLELDLVIDNAVIYTVDENNPTAQAVGIKDGRFAIVGANEEVRALAGERTQSLDARGQTILPGIFDSHNHLMGVGAKLAVIRLDECTSPEEMMELVRERAKITPKGDWIVGMGWNDGFFRDGRLPTRHDIDPATADHPVVLMRFFNMDVVNSLALELAGITRHTSDPAGGKVEHDADGEPNGLLRASAKKLVRALIPQPTLEQRKEFVRLGCEEMNRYGITSVVDPGLTTNEMHAYQAAYDDGILTVRMNLMPSWHGFREEESETHLNYRSKELGLYSGFGNEWLRLGGLKMAIDGGTTSRTAYMYEPFNGESVVRDFNRLDKDQLYRYFRMAQEQGWDVGIHCCGDRAQDIAVSAFARAMEDVPMKDARNNIIHAYFPTEYALDTMAKYHIAAVLQPTFLYYEGDQVFRDVNERLGHHYKPVRSYMNKGVTVTASSDVESAVSPDPFPALYALVTRKDRNGFVIGPDEGVSREEALRLYTMAGTWLTREERIKGSISPGKVADLVMIDRDYFRVADEEIKDIRVNGTMVNGHFVFSAD